MHKGSPGSHCGGHSPAWEQTHKTSSSYDSVWCCAKGMHKIGPMNKEQSQIHLDRIHCVLLPTLHCDSRHYLCTMLGSSTLTSSVRYFKCVLILLIQEHPGLYASEHKILKMTPGKMHAGQRLREREWTTSSCPLYTNKPRSPTALGMPLSWAPRNRGLKANCPSHVQHLRLLKLVSLGQSGGHANPTP